MSRIANETEALYGKEPDPSTFLDAADPGYSSFFSDALSWYNFAATKEQKKLWFLEYLTEVGGNVASATFVPDASFNTAGALARLWLRGVRNVLIEDKLSEFSARIVKEGNDLSIDVKAKNELKNKVKALQLQRDLTEAIGHIELVIDGFIETGASKFDMATWVRGSRISKEIQAAISTRFTKLRDEVLASDKDPDLKEAYSNYSKKQKTVLLGLLEDIINTKVVKVGSRKPRKKKTVSPDKLVKRLQFAKEFKELKLSSIDPTDIIGAGSLWVYNSKYRILANYVAADASGLSVKGSSILNISESESKSKKVRKPEVVVPEVLTMGKVPLRKVFDNLTTGFLKVNGRINKDTILLRVVK
jgi:hypothetical protein